VIRKRVKVWFDLWCLTNISFLSWWSILLVEETGVSGENHWLTCPVCYMPFSFGHCIVCPSSIYGFWLPLWYLQTILLTCTQILLNYFDFHSLLSLTRGPSWSWSYGSWIYNLHVQAVPITPKVASYHSHILMHFRSTDTDYFCLHSVAWFHC
jgi:hypothetical protein